MKERDRWARNDIGVRALDRGWRLVRNGVAKIDKREFGGEVLKRFEGMMVQVGCSDCYGTKYSVYDPETYRNIGTIYEYRDGKKLGIPGRAPRNPKAKD